jgi:SAM-dependent methyltransferase
MTIFEQYARYYDLIYQDKDYMAEVDYVATLLQRYANQACTILEFGSGTGIHGRLLAERGYHVFGLDLSSEMVIQARRSIRTPVIPPTPKKRKGSFSGSFNCSEGDIRNTSLKHIFDAVLAIYHVVSYQTSNTDIIATFQNANRHLCSNGIFLFDIWYGPAVLFQRPEIRIKRVEDGEIKIVRLAEPILDLNQSLVDVQYTIMAEEIITHKLTIIKETHRMRYFSLPEIEQFASHTGFKLIHSEEFLTGNPPGKDTWGVCCVLRKEIKKTHKDNTK